MIIYAADNIQHTVPVICEQYKPTRNDLFRKPRDTGRKSGALAKSENQGTSCYQGFLSLNWDSLHARINSHYEAWGSKKMKHKKIKAYR